MTAVSKDLRLTGYVRTTYDRRDLAFRLSGPLRPTDYVYPDVTSSYRITTLSQLPSTLLNSPVGIAPETIAILVLSLRRASSRLELPMNGAVRDTIIQDSRHSGHLIRDCTISVDRSRIEETLRLALMGVTESPIEQSSYADLIS